MMQGKFVSGLITGAALGVGMTILTASSDRKKKTIRKGASNLFKTVGTVIDNTMDMYK